MASLSKSIFIYWHSWKIVQFKNYSRSIPPRCRENSFAKFQGHGWKLSQTQPISIHSHPSTPKLMYPLDTTPLASPDDWQEGAVTPLWLNVPRIPPKESNIKTESEPLYPILPSINSTQSGYLFALKTGKVVSCLWHKKLHCGDHF